MFSPGKLGSSISAQASPTSYFPPAPPLDGFNPFQLNVDQRNAIANAASSMERDNQMQPLQPAPFPGGPNADGQQLLRILANMRGR